MQNFLHYFACPKWTLDLRAAFTSLHSSVAEGRLHDCNLYGSEFAVAVKFVRDTAKAACLHFIDLEILSTFCKEKAFKDMLPRVRAIFIDELLGNYIRYFPGSSFLMKEIEWIIIRRSLVCYQKSTSYDSRSMLIMDVH